ncbi:hypothetical protein RHGRI_021240 [Rhododendron griersonianum]|uniref:TPM domain-containing protein n=1 Tax=Rhododendron griersonianum TaxID=479676 RepID=A0AAV6JRK4_9ERIC|nr:hypothetical protein RHGRI_021240 [Rhododendron griersonianum]
METILSPHPFCPLLTPKSSSSKPLLPPSLPPRSKSPFFTKPINCSLKKQSKQSFDQSFVTPRSWFSHVQHGLAALSISLALNFCPVLHSGPALASEFDVINDGPPQESYLVDDAGVLSRVTKSDLKRLLSDLESRKNFHINFITVRKLTSKADAFEYADQVLERWYPSVEEGNNKGIVVLVTSQKEGAITGGPAFIKAVGDGILDATVSENLPGIKSTASSNSEVLLSSNPHMTAFGELLWYQVLATEEKYNEAIYSSAKRLVAAIDGLPDPGGPEVKDSKRESNFKTKQETEEKRGQFTLVVGGPSRSTFLVFARDHAVVLNGGFIGGSWGFGSKAAVGIYLGFWAAVFGLIGSRDLGGRILMGGFAVAHVCGGQCWQRGGGSTVVVVAGEGCCWRLWVGCGGAACCGVVGPFFGIATGLVPWAPELVIVEQES